MGCVDAGEGVFEGVVVDGCVDVEDPMFKYYSIEMQLQLERSIATKELEYDYMAKLREAPRTARSRQWVLVGNPRVYH